MKNILQQHCNAFFSNRKHETKVHDNMRLIFRSRLEANFCLHHERKLLQQIKMEVQPQILYLLLVSSIFTLVVAAKLDNQETEYSLVRAHPDTRPQVDTLQRIRYEKKINVGFWRTADWPGRHVDVWVAKSMVKKFSNILTKNNIAYSIKIKSWNVTEDKVTMKNVNNFDGGYRELDDITSELKRLAKVYSDRIKLIEIGLSFENRTIYGIQMKKGSWKKKPLIFFQCGIHGREWLSIASCMYVIRMMIFNDEYENDIQLITNHFEIIFVPVLNPDGYEFTKLEGNRFWRKSRSKTTDKSCPGVDLNRNYNFRWGGAGASPDICDETYGGTRPFSERETRAVASYLYKRRNDLKVFVDVHTFGQLLSHPWGFSRQPSFHQDIHMDVVRRISNRIRWGTGNFYSFGQTSSVLYETSGDSIDWAYGYLGVVHSYGIELRPRLADRRSLEGFNQTVKQILPTGRELFMVLTELASYVFTERNSKKS